VLGGVALLSQPLVIVAQLVVATRFEAPYDLTRNTISDLGVVGCGTVQAAGGPVEACSPWHAGMNASFVVIGSLLALGALLGALTIVRRPALIRTAAAMAMLFVAGISSAAVGFVPLDVDGDLHALVATPLFVTQPIALLLLGAVALGRGRRGLGGLLVVSGLVAAVGGVAFAVTLMTGDVGGLYERIALWPCQVGVATVGWSLLRAERDPVWETAA
jgi:hypothetical membrane protein